MNGVVNRTANLQMRRVLTRSNELHMFLVGLFRVPTVPNHRITEHSTRRPRRRDRYNRSQVDVVDTLTFLVPQ